MEVPLPPPPAPSAPAAPGSKKTGAPTAVPAPADGRPAPADGMPAAAPADGGPAPSAADGNGGGDGQTWLRLCQACGCTSYWREGAYMNPNCKVLRQNFKGGARSPFFFNSKRLKGGARSPKKFF